MKFSALTAGPWQPNPPPFFFPRLSSLHTLVGSFHQIINHSLTSDDLSVSFLPFFPSRASFEQPLPSYNVPNPVLFPFLQLPQLTASNASFLTYRTQAPFFIFLLVSLPAYSFLPFFSKALLSLSFSMSMFSLHLYSATGHIRQVFYLLPDPFLQSIILFFC